MCVYICTFHSFSLPGDRPSILNNSFGKRPTRTSFSGDGDGQPKGGAEEGRTGGILAGKGARAPRLHRQTTVRFGANGVC